MGRVTPLLTPPMDDPNWSALVRQEFEELRRTDKEGSERPLRQLVLLKQAIRTVTHNMHLQQNEVIAETSEDRLGWAMCFLRAAEAVRLTSMQRCARVYPYLTELCNHLDPNLAATASIGRDRDHALELARGAVTDELKALQNDTNGPDARYRAQRKEHILVKLKRLIPAATPGINVMSDGAGNLTTDPADMAKILQNHWGKVFTRQPVNHERLNDWQHDAFPANQADGIASGFRGRGSAQWRVRRRDVATAVKTSGNTMAGPDQIPYKS